MKNKELESIYKIFLQKIVPIKKGFRKRAVKIDSREVKKGDIFFALRGDNFNGNLFVQEVLKKDPTLVVLDSSEVFDKITKKIEKDFTGKSPSSIKKLRTSLEKIVLVKNSLKTFQDLAKKYRQDLKIPFLGITGSNGKTTTKELVHEVLSQKYNVLSTVGNLNNHIGVPLTILSIRKKHNFAVIEMGANHTGEIKTLAQIAKPDFGIITNIGKAHIGEFKNFANIKKTKKELYNEVLKNNGKIFINQEDVVLEKISQDFLQNQKVKYSEGGILESEKFLTIKIEKIKEIKTKLVGEYNLNNFLAAHTVGKYFKVSDIKIKEALQSYKPKNNRSEAEKTKKKNNIIWDCYNANPNSMSLAITSFSKKSGDKVFILGDMKELGNYSQTEHKKIINVLEKKDGLKILIGDEFGKLENKKKDFVFLKDTKSLKVFLKKKQFKNKNILVKSSKFFYLFELRIELKKENIL